MVAAPFAFIRNADVIGRVTASLQLFALIVSAEYRAGRWVVSSSAATHELDIRTCKLRTHVRAVAVDPCRSRAGRQKNYRPDVFECHGSLQTNDRLAITDRYTLRPARESGLGRKNNESPPEPG